ncbi:MAG: hypothetical protein C5B51_08435 [Terriglobia bacterium]|nr:MAG: hypothetical protein C5B51_08435 [Terriglobia bacterium]
MTPERWKRIRELFEKTADLPLADAEQFLRKECGGDTDLISEVLGMLEEHHRTGTLDLLPLWPASHSSSSALVFQPGQLVAGRYRIVRFINRGGMGEVYEAKHPLLPEHVALKTLLPEVASNAVMVDRFKQEIQLARKIAHANVCKVFDLEWHQTAGMPSATILFLTMEFLQGETLSERIQREGRMSTTEALPLLEQMAEALDAAHRCGVIHRDFKASNVMLVSSGGGIRAVVTDFGLARPVGTAEQPTLTLTNNLAGTLEYMAPELLSGSIASCRSDIYALGMVAYKMATGTLPFPGETPLAGAFLRAKLPVSSPRLLAPNLDPEWEYAILRALDREPGRRFATARSFSRALRGDPSSVTLALPRLTRRRMVGFGAALLAIAAGGFAWRTFSRATLPGEASRLYQVGVDDIHAGAYFAATKALDRATRLAPHFSPAHARLAESWIELDLPERAARELLLVRRENTSALSKLDQLEIEAVDLTMTREFAAAAAKYEEMLRHSDSAEIKVDLGRAYEKADKPDQAIRMYRQAAEGPTHNPSAWLRLGVLYSQSKRDLDAEAAFQEAERRYQLTSNLEGLTELLVQRGVAANRAQKYNEATNLLQKAMSLARDAGNVHQEISAKLTLANDAYIAGDAHMAEAYADESLATAQANGMEALAIRGLVNLGNAYSRKGDLSGAEQRFLDALARARRTNSPRLSALSLFALAALHDRLNRANDQIREAREALDYYQANHWLQQSFQCLTLIGRGETNRGNYAAALDSFRHLLAEAQKANDSGQVMAAVEGLGDVYFAEEQFPQALDGYEQFLKVSSSAEQRGYANLECAKTLWRLGQYPEAETRLKQADESGRNFPQLQLSIVRARAEMLLSQKRGPEAEVILERALSAGVSLNPVTGAALVRILGLSWIRAGRKQAGLKKCLEALVAAEQLKDPGTLREVQMALLEANASQRNLAEARNIFANLETALKNQPESRWRALALIAEVDPQYLAAARQALRDLALEWGEEPFRRYLTRRDVQQISWPLLHSKFAKS